MECELCHEDKPDVIRRMSPMGQKQWPGLETLDPLLCSACCAKAPDRAWMRETAEQPELPA